MKSRKCCSCNSNAAPKRRECNRCRYLRRVNEDPIKISYWRLKSSAKRRNKEFTLTLDQFREFCIETNYINKKGISGKAFHIDRIDESKGYTINNIQILSNSDNVKKYRKWVYSDEYGTPHFTTVTSKPIQVDNDCPF
jgi:hypothetical protein